MCFGYSPSIMEYFSPGIVDLSTLMLISGVVETSRERCTLAAEYCPQAQLCSHHMSLTTSILPSGRAAAASLRSLHIYGAVGNIYAKIDAVF